MRNVKSTFFLFLLLSSFSLLGCKKVLPTILGSVSLGQITEITDASAKVEIDITSDGRGTISDAGVSVNDRGCATCNGGLIFTTTVRKGKTVITMTGLKKATKYNIAAYVINEAGTFYTNEMTFTTSALLPTVSPNNSSISGITGATAVFNNHFISDDGGAPAFTKGICWSTNPSPTISDFRTKDTIINKAYGGYGIRLVDLKPNTKYYVRPYAINSVGVGYGKELSFTTDPNNSCQTKLIEPDALVIRIIPTSADKFLLLGGFQTINGLNHYNSALFNNDGTIDNSYLASNSDYSVNLYTYNDATYLPNGKIIVPVRHNNTGKFTVMRLNANGSIDNSFNIPSGTSSQIIKTIVLNDGKIILVGRFTDFNGIPANRIVKLNADGSRDGTFTLNPNLSFGTIVSAALLNNGSFVVQSSATSGFVNYVIKTDGSIDTGSNLHNTMTPNWIISVLKNGQFLCTSPNYAITKMNANGTNDNSFNSIKIALSPTANTSYIVHELTDGKYLIGVNSSINSQQIFTLARLNTNGTVDASFGATGTLEFRNGNIQSVNMSGDGKILVGGSFNNFMDKSARNFIKLNANGSLCN